MKALYQEPETLLQVAAGDEGAFRLFFDRHWDAVYSVAYAFTKSVELSEEIVQDVFVKIWTHREKLATVESPANYLFIIARNHILNILQRKVFRQPVTVELREYFQQAAEQADLPLMAKESKLLVEKAVAALPEQQQKVFRLIRQEGLTHEEIAGQLGISRQTVKKHMQLALQAIRRYLQSYAGGALLLAALLELYFSSCT